MSVSLDFPTVLAIGCIGAAFGSITAELFQIYRHRREAGDVRRREKDKFAPTPGCRYTESRFWAVLAAGMAFTLGMVLIVGGDRRTSASAYSGLVAHGGPNIWGAAFITVAVITWLCAWRFKRWLDWVLLLQALPFAGIALTFAVAAVRFPDANLTAAPIYAWIMIMHACLADYARKQY